MFDPPKELLEPHFFDFDGDLTAGRSRSRCTITSARRRSSTASTRYRADGRSDCAREAPGALLAAATLRRRVFASGPCPLSPRAMSDAPDKPDYRRTVFLPKTDFPMKAGLPQKEPAILARWQEDGPLRPAARGPRRPREVHPPRRPALRQWRHPHRPCDEQDRSRTSSSAPSRCSARTRPTSPAGTATACRSNGRSRSSIARRSSTRTRCRSREFRAECRAYAEHWVAVQREQFKRLGIGGDGTIPISP